MALPPDTLDKIISIHAPVKGATGHLPYEGRLNDISIHAPVKGATKAVPVTADDDSYFNPRTREGCDQLDERDQGAIYGISIHAPVKGATTCCLAMSPSSNLFQSTHP